MKIIIWSLRPHPDARSRTIWKRPKREALFAKGAKTGTLQHPSPRLSKPLKRFVCSLPTPHIFHDFRLESQGNLPIFTVRR
ncbi:MAG: hypothetical protein V4720_13520 [Pseudomonadota bacterium]